jgi:hypothetical protein
VGKSAGDNRIVPESAGERRGLYGGNQGMFRRLAAAARSEQANMSATSAAHSVGRGDGGRGSASAGVCVPGGLQAGGKSWRCQATPILGEGKGPSPALSLRG